MLCRYLPCVDTSLLLHHVGVFPWFPPSLLQQVTLWWTSSTAVLGRCDLPLPWFPAPLTTHSPDSPAAPCTVLLHPIPWVKDRKQQLEEGGGAWEIRCCLSWNDWGSSGQVREQGLQLHPWHMASGLLVGQPWHGLYLHLHCSKHGMKDFSEGERAACPLLPSEFQLPFKKKCKSLLLQMQTKPWRGRWSNYATGTAMFA